MSRDVLEISDLVVAFDAETLERLPVRKADVMRVCRAQGDRRAARIVDRLPERDGILDGLAVDALLIRAHTELQRLSEEFEHGQRVAELLRPMLATLRQHGVATPIRIVDVGCGLGYVVRWLGMFGNLGNDVELIGVDYNLALLAEARRLAELEQINVHFLRANAFQLEVGATVYISTGVVHHFRGDDLTSFFQAHERDETAAWVHFDFQPSAMAPLGAWLFHIARFREPLARHDGVHSAIRAHDAAALLRAGKEGAPGFDLAMYSTRLGLLPIARPFHTLVGIRPRFREAFVAALGRRSGRLQAWCHSERGV